MKISSADHNPNTCTTLLWFLQCNLSASELGRFIRNCCPAGRATPAVISAPDEIISRAVDCVSEDRSSALKAHLEQIAHQETRMPLLSRFEIETFTQKILRADFPLALRFSGAPEVLKKRRVAIVGSRHPTFYGREQAARFSRSLSEQGVCVISGAAIGIDTVANLVSHANGASVAVLGSGLAAPYPRSNIPLLHSMERSGRGLILSEFNDFQRAEKWNFPRRNRIIAALCDFLLVIEASLGSGTLITAHLAAELGVDVGALPGPVHSPTSQGSNLLIKEGAFCIENPEEILERFVNLRHQESGHKENLANDADFRQHAVPSLF